eukprot:9554815-Alexandrium_andersonii.AAC.1
MFCVHPVRVEAEDGNAWHIESGIVVGMAFPPGSIRPRPPGRVLVEIGPWPSGQTAVAHCARCGRTGALQEECLVEVLQVALQCPDHASESIGQGLAAELPEGTRRGVPIALPISCWPLALEEGPQGPRQNAKEGLP